MQFPGPPPYHWRCFIDGQVPIYTVDGWKKIGKIEVDDLVLTHKGRFRKVTELLQTPKQTPEIMDIYLDSKHILSSKLTVTIDHPVLVNGRWKLAKNIVAGGKVGFLGNRCLSTNEIIPYYTNYKDVSTRSKALGGNWAKDPVIRARQSKKVRASMLKQYEDGTRDRNTIAKNANVKMRELVEAGLWSGCEEGNRNTSERMKKMWEEDIDFRDKMVDRMLKDNPMKRESLKALMRRKTTKRLEKRPETHPSRIVAQKDFVSKLEKAMERILDSLGQSYIKQHKIGCYWVDFAIPELNIVIECDGDYWHQDKEREAYREGLITLMGWDVFRFKERELMKDSLGCVEKVARILQNHKGEFVFTTLEVKSVIRRTIKKARTLYNFAVEEDESYIAKGFVVHNCRSMLLPVLKKWDELGSPALAKFKEFPKGQRASMDGLVPADLTYSDWLKKKELAGPEFANKLLGKGKAQLWRDGKITLQQLVDNSGQPFTLKELKKTVRAPTSTFVRNKSGDLPIMKALNNTEGAHREIEAWFRGDNQFNIREGEQYMRQGFKDQLQYLPSSIAPIQEAKLKAIQKRAEVFNSALDKTTPFSGTVYRGGSAVGQEGLASLKKGDSWVQLGSVSTSKEKKVAEEFLDLSRAFGHGDSYLLEIKAKSGVDISSIANKTFEYQKEVIVRGNTQYKVVDVVEKKYRGDDTFKHIFLEEI